MKKSVIILLIILLVGVVAGIGGYFFMKYKNSELLVFEISDVKPDFKITSVFDVIKELADLIVPVIIGVKISNYSPMSFRINQLSIDCFSQIDNSYIAYNTEPLAQPFDILPNQNNIVYVKYNVKLQLLAKEIKGTATLLDKGFQILQSYLSSGKFGVSLKIKGFAIADNIKIKVEEIVNM